MSLHPPVLRGSAAARTAGARTSPVLRQGLACAALFAALTLCAAAAWRLSGRAPSFPDLLEGVDIALWLAALLLVPRFEQNLSRLLMHNPPLSMRLQLGLLGSMELAEAGLALGLAALGLLFAYPAGDPITRLETTEGISMAVPLGAFLALVLLLVAPVVVLISSTVLFAARRLGGTGFGTLLWGAIALAIHSELLGVKFPGNLYSTLGGYSGRLLDLLDGLASQAYSSMYMVEIAGRVLATPIVVAFAALSVLAAILLRFDCKRASVPVSWTAAALASGTVAVYALAQTYEWATDPALRYPGSFEALAGCGLSVALTLRLLCSWADGQPADTGRFNKELLWLLLTGLSWIVMTEPAVRAGEASQLGILVYCLSCVFLLTAGAVLIEWIARIPPQAGWLVAALRMAFLLILVVPLGPQLQQLSRLLPVFMTRSVFIPEEALSASLFALCLAALSAFAWLSLLPLGNRRKHSEARNKAAG